MYIYTPNEVKRWPCQVQDQLKAALNHVGFVMNIQTEFCECNEISDSLSEFHVSNLFSFYILFLDKKRRKLLNGAACKLETELLAKALMLHSQNRYFATCYQELKEPTTFCSSIVRTYY